LKYNLLHFCGVETNSEQLQGKIMNMRSLHIVCRVVVVIIGLMMVIPLNARRNNSRHRTFKNAISAADHKDYETAMSLYAGILDEEPDHVDALTQLGICLVTTNQFLDSALMLFQRALNIIPADDHFSPFGIELQLTIARTLNLNQEPEKALHILRHLRENITDTIFISEISHEMVQTRNAAVLLKNPVPLKITNLGATLNSEYDDHSPLVSLTGNRIFFTSRRSVGRDYELADGQYPEKVFFAEHDGKAWKSPRPLNEFFTRAEHKSILSLSPDGEQIFLFKNDRGVKNIYVSYFRNDEWQAPQKLPGPVNSQWDETHASLSPDQSKLFFTSNRPGGFGGLDLYVVKKDEYGQWGEAVNMGASVNSAWDEETPMLHPDGTTLYFASEGHSSMGRLDIFFSQKLPDGLWTEAANMGHPINTPDDDFFFVPTLDKSKAYYASYRFSENVGRSDIYQVEFDSLFNGSLAVIEGTIKNSHNLPVEHIRILVSRESDHQQVGDYRPNLRNGKYLLILEAGESYTIREATPEAIETERIIHVPGQLAYTESNQVVMLQDPRMMSPLKPGLMRHEIDTRQLAAGTSHEAMPMVSDTTYTVQVLALKHYPEAGFWFFSGLDLQSVNALEGRDGYLRYVTGEFKSRDEAESYRLKIQQNGRFSDAWIRSWEPLKEISKEERYLTEK
jgi:tetratricopeptide (TPR) repeat protein